MRSKSQGFNHIELAVVVAVIATLAGFAIPRFTSIENEGRVAAIAALSASIRNASSLAHAQWLASGKPDTIEVEGRTIKMRNGYPDVDSNGLPSTLPDTAGFSATIAPGAVIYKKYGAPKPEQCSVVYSPATSSAPPRILLQTANLSGC